MKRTKLTTDSSILDHAMASMEIEPTVATQPQTLKVKAGLKYRGARQAWYEVLCAYDGKPVSDFLAAVEANRPSKYGAKSKHAGTPEPVAGWFRFFVRTGAATLT